MCCVWGIHWFESLESFLLSKFLLKSHNKIDWIWIEHLNILFNYGISVPTRSPFYSLFIYNHYHYYFIIVQKYLDPIYCLTEGMFSKAGVSRTRLEERKKRSERHRQHISRLDTVLGHVLHHIYPNYPTEMRAQYYTCKSECRDSMS